MPHSNVDSIDISRLSKDAAINIYGGLIAAVALFAVIGVISYSTTRTLSRDAESVTHTHEVLSALEDVVSLAKDAETGQRGYVITEDDRYLQPYRVATERIYQRIDDLRRLTADNREQLERIPVLVTHVDAKLEELKQTISLRRDAGFQAAQRVVVTDAGMEAMDRIRDQVTLMEDAERRLRGERLEEMARAYRVAVISGVVMALSGILLSFIVFRLLKRAALLRQRQQWLQTAQVKLGELMVGEQQLHSLSQKVLRFLAEYLRAPVGAMFVKEHAIAKSATYGVPDAGVPDEVAPGEGLIGQAVADRRPFLLNNVPSGYLRLGSALGEGTPTSLGIFPVMDDEGVGGVIELGFLSAIDDSAGELLKQVSEPIAVAIRAVQFRARLQNLLEETQRQAEELQAQGEELRVSNEELEEQSRALRESQARLEQQQTELEQINAQLEEQSQILESQRDEVSQAKEEVEQQARDLELASRYKSDFLANMSHELRTPLNSSLILAKLLADNPAGNLTDEQVEFARTIQGAGNDLLTLINDILDLSKIEAGRLEVSPEPVQVSALVQNIERLFAPIAMERKISFDVSVAPSAPEALVTDIQRLEQILKNLLSNAFKFTEQGQVTLEIGSAGSDQVTLKVRDSGIGIPPQQQAMIFEAFRQADGTTNRKYGGTGLGLSISRELAKLLGGTISLESQVGQGSTFTLCIPVQYAGPTSVTLATSGNVEVGHSRPAASAAVPLGGQSSSREPAAIAAVGDDRATLASGRRVILVVEDDNAFARILRDMVHEQDFQCLVAARAEDAVAMAVQYLPSAILLDLGLPDHSGLSVLDRLKHDRRTRHIPIHVVSASDHTQTALSLGAVGYMLKPVNREQLAEALQQLESHMTHRMRRVLVVEDDPVQLDSVKRLLHSQDVETIGASTAAECLEKLETATFDCMVLDLSLPDASGYSLLETLSREDAYSFPPVIIYTGRELSSGEEQQLRRYSKSIIIKGAKSPERLLDEVTLFLHQVVSELPPEQQKMLERSKSRDAAIEGRRILIVEDDVRNVFALTSILEQRGATIQIARNGLEGLRTLEQSAVDPAQTIDLVLMDVMMPEMDGLTAMTEIRKRKEWTKLPVIMLTAKAMKDDQQRCLAAGANDYMAKPIDVERLLSLVRVWMPR